MTKRTILVGFATAGLAAVLVAGLALVSREGASANQCASACYAAHSQCRVASKGSPACDSQLSACLARCGR